MDWQMRFYLHTQHLQQRTDPLHCQDAGQWGSVRELQAALVRANRWNVNKDTFLTQDGVMLVNFHTWAWYGVTVRSRIIESYSFLGLSGPESVPDEETFRNQIIPTLNDRPETQRKIKRFESAGRPLDGDYCHEYYPGHAHITSCPYCSQQFIKDVTDPFDKKVLRLKEENRKGIKGRRETNGHERAKTGPYRYRKTAKFKFALSMSAENAD